ncbi:hypothetical protein M9H77_31661 [Catharanthus roseus]|uniref:Uncharacterized protein n=1 Tax=Catharanthus roseus TaxID=4058 RepID=A0ACC0A127_CATRO|nr:hypothetical protein M9H77_31661 [Catharanthus roseus]
MEVSSILVFFFFFFFIQILQLSQSATVVVDGITEWRNPTVQIGDTVIFQHKYQHNVYIFQNQRAFSLCNFTQATLLSKPNSTSYTWHPSRTGFFYFSFNNGSNKDCLEGQKLAVKVMTLSAGAPTPQEKQPSLPDKPPMAAPPQITGGIVSSSPAFPWPFRPRETDSPGPAPSAMFPATSPMVPDKSGYPLINSNPAVPLPTGEVDSATIRPVPISGAPETQENISLRIAVLHIFQLSSSFSRGMVRPLHFHIRVWWRRR